MFSLRLQSTTTADLITDVGSTRTTVIAAARRELGKGFARYAPMHPIAGGEMPGVEYAAPDLFVGCKVISTPEVECLSRHVIFGLRHGNVWERILSR